MVHESYIVDLQVYLCALLIVIYAITVIRSGRELSRLARVEQEFHRNEQRYRLMFDDNPLPMMVYDLETLAIRSVNDAAVTHYGYTREEFLSLTLKDIRPAEDVPAIVDFVTKLRTGYSQSGRWRHQRKDGTIMNVEVTSHPVTFRGRLCRFVLINDVTERIQAEERLRRSEEKYRDLFENANDAIFIVGPDLRYLDANHKAVELLGHPKEELLTMRISDLLLPEQLPKSEAAFEKLRKAGAYEKFVGKVRTRDGRWLDVEVSSSAIMEGVVVAGSRDIMRDITERKRMEEELLKIQKMESLGVLAGGIAHDFNNLLTAILGNVSLAMLDAEPSGQVYGRLMEAERASMRARDLTYQLLTFSKGGAPVKKTISLSGPVREAAGFALRGSSARCRLLLADGLYPVEADEGQISQVINNLVINADQAMPGGGVVTLIGENVVVGPDSPLPLVPGDYVKVSVADEGIGIPHGHHEKIFDPYFTTKQKGSGLGLATSYSIVKRHGGYITVESELGKGSTFHVYLPSSAQALVPVEQKEGATVAGGGRVLVMDDEEMVREVAGSILRKIGYEVEYAQDGNEALEQYAKAKSGGKPFIAVIMDLTIPGGMGGRETITKLREIDPAARAIVSSGYSNDPVMAAFRDYGFSGVVSKPYTVQKLGEVVREITGGAEGPA